MSCNSENMPPITFLSRSRKTRYNGLMMDSTDDDGSPSLAGLFDGLEGGAGAPVLSLSGMALEAAGEALERALRDGAPDAWLAIRFDPPRQAGAESLFQPVGRRLRAALRDGRIQICRPLAPGGEAADPSFGFVIRFSR